MSRMSRIRFIKLWRYLYSIHREVYPSLSGVEVQGFGV